MNVTRVARKFIVEYKILVRSVFILLVVCLGFGFGVLRAGRTTWDMVMQSSAISNEIDTFSQKASILGSLDEDSLKQKLNDLVAAVPTDKSVPTLLSTVESLSGQSGVALLDMTVFEIGAISSMSAQPKLGHPSGARAVQFSAIIEGTLVQTQQFLLGASGVRRLLGIRSFDLTFTGPDAVRTSLEMDAYYTPLPSQVGAVAGKLQILSDEEEASVTKVANLPNLAQTTVLLPPVAAGGPLKADPFAP